VNPRRLYRSRDRQLAGVAGGMAEYLDIDPTIVRILWIIVGIASGGLVLLAYFILALVIPQAPYATAPGAPAGWATAGSPAGASTGWSSTPGVSTGWTAPPAAPMWGSEPAADATGPSAPQSRQQAGGRGIGAGAIFGVVLIVVGGIALANVVLPGWVSGAILGPAVVLALGAALLVSSIRRDDADASVAATAPAPSTAPAASAEPANLDAPVEAVQPWDVADTQSVDPAVYGQGSGTAIVPSAEEAATQG
jgi:phage shock protein C